MRHGNIQMLPNPIAEPALAMIKASLPDQSSRLSVGADVLSLNPINPPHNASGRVPLLNATELGDSAVYLLPLTSLR
ncbi:MAG: hypothetical protein DDT39_01555 [Firmicutes bacterium]|nr:hypothetical protein [candidate division NPL-UPA2 bacterium]